MAEATPKSEPRPGALTALYTIGGILLGGGAFTWLGATLTASASTFDEDKGALGLAVFAGSVVGWGVLALLLGMAVSAIRWTPPSK